MAPSALAKELSVPEYRDMFRAPSVPEQCQTIRFDVRAHLLSYAEKPDEPQLDPSALEELFAALKDNSEDSRQIIENALLLCRGALLSEHAVAVLRDELKVRAWGIVCPTCEIPAAPKWTKQDRPPLGGRMQCTHTKASMSVSHSAWAALDDRIRFVERAVYVPSPAHGTNGKFTALEQK